MMKYKYTELDRATVSSSILPSRPANMTATGWIDRQNCINAYNGN